MKKLFPTQFRRDLVKLSCFTIAFLGIVGIFTLNSTLSTPTLLSVVATMLLSPSVASIERKGYSRNVAILFLFLLIGLFILVFGIWSYQAGQYEWNSLKETAPDHFRAAIQKLRAFESDLKSKYQFLNSVHVTDSLLSWGRQTGDWLLEHGPSLMGSFLGWIFIIPFITFVLLSEGRSIRKKFLQLIPNRYFESFFLMSNQITNAIANYLQAKLLEASLVGGLVFIGLLVIGAPYALVLAIAAGITNIIPYLGPFLGLAPAILILAFDPRMSTNIVGIILVYVIANIVDTVIIFPLIVAKLVKFHPLLLIAVVAFGGQYYGLVGMLISVPVATAIKVVIQEIYYAVYEQHPLD